MGLFSRLFSGSGGSEPSVPQAGFVDSDCVTIGGQVWSARNLDVATFRNGEPIPEARTPEEWVEAGKAMRAAWCYYNNDPELGATYGRLYNWFAVADKRGLGPKGWHVPADLEWAKAEDREFARLISHLGGTHYAGSKLKEAGTARWAAPNNNPADNSSGFTALPGGTREASGGFYSIGRSASWWTASANGTEHAHILSLQSNSGGVVLQYTSKCSGQAVRCLRD